jgi:putative glycosyltransferase (TIGR04372 family)
MGNYSEAEAFYEVCLKSNPLWPQALVNLAHAKLTLGFEREAVDLLQRAVAIDPKFAMAHQNLAARYDRARYKPVGIDLEARPECLLYDAYNLCGERAIHIGMEEKGLAMYTQALHIQRRIGERFHLPGDLMTILIEQHGVDPALPIRILPYEWVTQIGHLGYLDTYKKIQELGWREKSNVIVLAPPSKIVNKAFLEYWRPFFQIISERSVIDQLFPYQRFVGDSFNGFLDEQGEGRSWCDIGAKAHIAWDESRRGPLLTVSEEHQRLGRDVMEALGLPKDAWFVALHARDSGFYSESWGHGQNHRNATIESYLPAIRHITKLGGWVVRMGDSTMKNLPPMSQVIDYAHSGVRKDWLDVFLWGSARFFLGTTSGPTNAVIALGTPCALVNCLSNYSQLWNNKVIFSLKPLWSQRENRFLTIREFTSSPIRGKLFNLRILASEGIFPISNSPEDIVSVVDEMFEYLENRGSVTANQYATVFQNEIADRTMWGSARPGALFLERNHAKFFD